jgi:hypothetical protein
MKAKKLLIALVVFLLVGVLIMAAAKKPYSNIAYQSKVSFHARVSKSNFNNRINTTHLSKNSLNSNGRHSCFFNSN